MTDSKDNMTVMPGLTVIAGGIGAGKSVVCMALRTMGYAVYDCDAEARRIMDGDPEIHRRICEEVCAEAVTPDGRLDREAIAATVFSDDSRLKALNAIVHGAVIADLRRWYERHGAKSLFVETALLYETRLDLLCGHVWCVTAPEDLRVSRVMARNGLDAKAVHARIESQHDYIPDGAVTLLNDGVHALLPQILDALRSA